MHDFDTSADYQREDYSNPTNSPSQSLPSSSLDALNMLALPPVNSRYYDDGYNNYLKYLKECLSPLSTTEIDKTSGSNAEHAPSPTLPWSNLSPYFESSHSPHPDVAPLGLRVEANGLLVGSPRGYSSENDPKDMLAPSTRDRSHKRYAYRPYPSSRPSPYPHFPVTPSSRLSPTVHKTFCCPKCLRICTRNEQYIHLKTCRASGSTFDVAVSTASNILLGICSDKARYKKLLHLDEDTSQLVLDVLQTISDRARPLNHAFESVLLKAMLRVSQRFILFPRSYILSGINRDEYPVASGHFGEVYQGSYNGQKVALKVFKLYSCTMTKVNDLLKAFYKEAILWRNLSHPNLLPFYGIYQLGDSGKRICLVSPWISNGNITQYLQENYEANRLHLTLDIASGISYLHENSIVHGDLKGANVLVSNSGVALLADFGLSSMVGSTSILAWTSVETTKSNAGTVRWQAPELIAGADDGRTKESDIYAFACVCYEVFVGKVPFYEFTNDVTVIHKIMTLGQRPSRPDVNCISYTQWGLKDWIWSLIEECWREAPNTRPIASDVVGMLSSRKEFLREDKGYRDSWGDFRQQSYRAGTGWHPSLPADDVQRCITLLNAL